MMTELRAAGEKFLRKLYEIGKIITKSQARRLESKNLY